MDIERAINGLLTRYAQVQESVLTLGRWREAATQEIRRVAAEVQLMGKAAMDRERVLTSLKADNRTFQGQLRSLSVKVDELSRELQNLRKESTDLAARAAEEIRALKDRMYPPDLAGGHPGLPYADYKTGQVR